MRAAVYCRVSTDKQESEGTSLQTQLEACQKYCLDKGYSVVSQTAEAYSGLSLERPKLNELRRLIRENEINVLVIYCLDRLSRDPVHGVILTEELEKHHVALEAVTENVDSSDLGKLITYVRGYAAKVETEKIRERTRRGARKRAEMGKIPFGGTGHLYGYCYVRGKEQGQGVRIENPDESKWAKEMFRWLVEERLSTGAITYRLRDLVVPTPSGKGYWRSSTVKKILKNPAYSGKTYVFSYTTKEPKFKVKSSTQRKKSTVVRTPREDWVELPNATPAIISEKLYMAAQEQLAENRRMAERNPKGEYLLHGHVYCQLCRRAYWASGGLKVKNGRGVRYPYYKCSGKIRKVSPIKCTNKQHTAKRIESLVWAEVEKILSQPEVVFRELANQTAKNQTPLWEKDLDTVLFQLANREKQKARVWRAFELTGDEATFRRDIGTITKDFEQLAQRKAALESQIESSKQFDPDISDIKKACGLVASKLHNLSYEEKRLALRALQIRVMVDGDNLTLKGIIPIAIGSAEDTSPRFGNASGIQLGDLKLPVFRVLSSRGMIRFVKEDSMKHYKAPLSGCL